MMRLPRFRFVSPRTVAEAADILASARAGDAMIVAGGTDLIPNMKRRRRNLRRGLPQPVEAWAPELAQGADQIGQRHHGANCQPNVARSPWLSLVDSRGVAATNRSKFWDPAQPDERCGSLLPPLHVGDEVSAARNDHGVPRAG